VDGAQAFATSLAGARIRPLAVQHDLGAITHLMLPQGIAPPALEAAHYLRMIAETARKLVREALIEASATGRLADIFTAIEAVSTALVSVYEQHFAYQRRLDAGFEQALAAVECRAGCSFCCRLKVTATLLEIVRIAAAMAGGRFPDRRPAVHAAAADVAGLSDRERLARKIPCPLLLDGACSIYEARPLTCRALLSRSASLCERQFEAGAGSDEKLLVPSPLTPRLIAASLINGQIAALRDLGLSGHLVELVSALAALQREPMLAVRWLNGEDVLARA